MSDLPSTADQVLRTLSAAAALQLRLDAMLRELDLTADRWRALAFVGASPGVSMSELAECLAMPTTTVTRTVDALVDLGAAYRAPDARDRRRVTLHLSAKGSRLLAAAGTAVARAVPPVT